ncbi:uncharacterized protein B0T15DRAFT_500971 [Chaetomium strumarium]|uniref:Uncharacterized protein n=1 Tax=Chaetomium strumarium TaxID=1170767 RepID=A0AAJ0M505_9PEZI|nr:hypothetical protein B0T15DRAFT_500971 [Chaetomium strumarium]
MPSPPISFEALMKAMMPLEKDTVQTGRQHDGNEYRDDSTDRLVNEREKNPRWERPISWYQRRRAVAVYAGVSVVQLVIAVGLAVLLARTRPSCGVRSSIVSFPAVPIALAVLAVSDLAPLWLAPANEAIDWSVQEFDSGNGLHGNFIGPPRPALEKAWAELLRPMNLRLGREDIVAYHREGNAVALSDGSGYAGSLNVYHELHCVIARASCRGPDTHGGSGPLCSAA